MSALDDNNAREDLSPDRGELLALISRLRRGMADWAADEDHTIPDHALEAYNDASSLLGLPLARGEDTRS